MICFGCVSIVRLYNTIIIYNRFYSYCNNNISLESDPSNYPAISVFTIIIINDNNNNNKKL